MVLVGVLGLKGFELRYSYALGWIGGGAHGLERGWVGVIFVDKVRVLMFCWEGGGCCSKLREFQVWGW